MHISDNFKELSSYPPDGYGWNFLKSHVERAKIILAQVRIFRTLTLNISSESCISLLEMYARLRESSDNFCSSNFIERRKKSMMKICSYLTQKHIFFLCVSVVGNVEILFHIYL